LAVSRRLGGVTMEEYLQLFFLVYRILLVIVLILGLLIIINL
jgi:hypothetical protein